MGFKNLRYLKKIQCFVIIGVDNKKFVIIGVDNKKAISI